MARVTHVKKAQQRYAMVPVLDENGEQKKTPVMRSNGTQKTTKSGKLVFRSISIEDRTQPLPPHTCGACRQPIEVGQPYKHISPKSGPYGGATLRRHESCPDWHVWDYSHSMSAQLARIDHDAQDRIQNVESQDEAVELAGEIAEEIREIAQQKEEGADNIEEGFGHETEMSTELRDTAEQLNTWADDIENVDIPDYPEAKDIDCEECEGSGEVEDATPDAEEGATVSCSACDGAGQVEADEPSEEQIDEWKSAVDEAINGELGNCPV
jgi:hypothetical protein